jgi:hypothetical protein
LFGGIFALKDLAISALVSDVAMHLSNFPAAFAARWATCRRFVKPSAELATAKVWNSFKMDVVRVVHVFERVGGVKHHCFAGYVM